MSPDGRTLLGEGFEIVYAPHHPYLEGPKVHKRDGWYYVMAPGGGVPTGWQVAYRSRRLTGPYEERIVLARGSTAINGPHQGAFVDTPDNDWWFVHFQDTGPFGRITHLQPVLWPTGDDWPQVGFISVPDAVGEPVSGTKSALLKQGGPRFAPVDSDEFEAGFLGPQWQWQANHNPAWADFVGRPGWLRLLAMVPHPEKLELTPHLLTQKYPARSFTVETMIEITGSVSAGLVVTGGASSACLQLCSVTTARRLVYSIENRPVFECEAPGVPSRLRVTVNSSGECTFAFADASGAYTNLAEIFTAREGGWMGAKVGLFANGESGHADFDYFRFHGATPSSR
jgi:beta-xylosidase